MLPLIATAPLITAQDSFNWVTQMAVSSQQATISHAVDENSPLPIKALIVYADNVEEERYRNRINQVLHTVSKQIKRDIYPTLCETIYGDLWQKGDCLETSHLILLLVGPDFVATDFCYCKELEDTVERHSFHQTYVVPIYLRPCLVEDVPFGHLPFLPTQAQGAVSTQDEDIAFQKIAKGIVTVSKLIIQNLL